MRVARLALPGLLTLAMVLTGPAAAFGHGGGEGAPAPAEPRAGQTAEQAEVEALAMQPARVLAQQAIALLQVRGDEHEAGVRLDAALESQDKGDLDVPLLARATRVFDGGNAAAAIPLLDAALSRPLGSDSGKALHEAERSYSPAQNTQETVGIVAGAVLLLAGGLALGWGRRRRRPAS